jgi:hypothetical protein
MTMGRLSLLTRGKIPNSDIKIPVLVVPADQESDAQDLDISGWRR